MKRCFRDACGRIGDSSAVCVRASLFVCADLLCVQFGVLFV